MLGFRSIFLVYYKILDAIAAYFPFCIEKEFRERFNLISLALIQLKWLDKNEYEYMLDSLD